MEKITEREQEILNILKREPMIAQEELAGRLSISRSAAAVHISNLMRKGFIIGRGYVFNDRTGVVVLGSAEIKCQAMAKKAHAEQGSINGKISFSQGGVGYNVAIALAGMNLPVILMTALGQDDEGEMLLHKIKEAGVDTNHILRSKNLSTAKVLQISDANNKPQLAIESQDIFGMLSTKLIWYKEPVLKNCAYIFTDSTIASETFQEICKIASEAHIPVAYKPGRSFVPRELLQHLDKISLLVLNPAECALLSGIQVRDMDEAMQAAGKLAASGVENVVVAVGETGVVMATTDEIIPLQSMPTQIVDLCTHSDVLTAGILYALVNGYNYRQAIRIGMRTASVAAQAQNAGEVNFEEEPA